MCTTQKLNFSVKDFFSKCKQIHCEVAKAQYPSGQVPAQDTTVYRNLSDSWSSLYILTLNKYSSTMVQTSLSIQHFIFYLCLFSEIKLLSLKKPAYQSSTYFNHPTTNSLASKAVDGNRNPIFEQRSCSHTAISGFHGPWWRVDLLRNYHITRVDVFPRKGDGRLRNVSMFAYDNLKWIICKVGLNMLQPQTISFNENCLGQIFQIKQYSTYPLLLCEVEIYGYQ